MQLVDINLSKLINQNFKELSALQTNRGIGGIFSFNIELTQLLMVIFSVY